MKGTTRKINSQEKELLNFLAPLTRVALPLMQYLLTALAITVSVSSALTATVSETNAVFQKKALDRECVL